MAVRKPLFMDQTEGYSEEMADSDSIVLGGLTMGGDIVMGGNKITGLADGVAGTDAVTLAQLDAAIAAGARGREELFTYHQLNDTDGIYAAEVVFFDNRPASGDSITLKNGSLTRTYDFVANQGSEAAATDVSIETDAKTAMQRLVTRVNADAGNTEWNLVFTDVYHLHLNGSDGIIEVMETNIPASNALSDSRIYGTFATQADLQVVPFSDGTDAIKYSEQTAETAPSADPASGRFGVSRANADLTDGEIHLVLDTDAQYTWDGDAVTWHQLTGGGSIVDATSGSGGAVKGKVTFDSDKGLFVAAGVAEIELEADGAIVFDAANGGLEINLESANPSLDIASNQLGLKEDPSGGIQTTAAGVGIKINDTPDTLDVDANGLKVTGLPTAFKINDTAVSGNVTAPNLGTLTAGATSDAGALHSHQHSALLNIGTDDHHPQLHTIASHTDTVATGAQLNTLTAGASSNADSLHTHANVQAAEADRVANDYNVDAAVGAGDPVYFTSADEVSKADAGAVASSHVIGVAETAQGSVGSPATIVTSGPCRGVLSGASVNQIYFLQSGGGIGTTMPSGGNRIVVVGYAMNTTDLFVHIKDTGRRSA